MNRTFCNRALQEQKPVTPLSRKKCIFRDALKAKPKPNKAGRALSQQKNVGRALARQNL